MFRIAAYADLAYRRGTGGLYAEMAFAHFLCALGPEVGRLQLVGRLNPEAPSPAHHRLPAGARLAPLPYYADASRPLDLLRTLPRTVRAFWRALDDADGALVFGPHPLATVFVLVALLRRRRVALGIRQHYLGYIGSRHPGRRGVLAAARVIDGLWRALIRVLPTIVVGPDLARRHRRAPRLLEITVSLVDERELDAAPDVRAPGGELRVLSVGRLDREKNPLMLADVLARLRRDGGDWRLVVCGDGPLRGPLAERLREQGVGDAAELLGHVPVEDGLRRRYRDSDVLLHVSWTEGVPQVLLEAFAARLPVVATDVGGVAAVTGGRAALLVPPGDPDAAAQAVLRLAAEPELRDALVDAGVRIARTHTLQAESRRIAAFLRASWRPARVPT